MSPQDTCPGVALDRNFNVAFNNAQSLQSCNPQYPGGRPFSEPETQAIRDVFHAHGHKMIAYIHVHAGGYHEHIYKVFKKDLVMHFSCSLLHVRLFNEGLVIIMQFHLHSRFISFVPFVEKSNYEFASVSLFNLG